jgi:hypothetical protein
MNVTDLKNALNASENIKSYEKVQSDRYDKLQ